MKILVRQFKSPLIWILLIAAAITGFILKELVDTAVILLTVAVNTLLGFWQEYRADRALRAISKLLTTKIKVIREGKRQEIDKDNLALGDIVVLEIGRIAPADGVLVEGDSVAMNEAILTGESIPVNKSPCVASVTLSAASVTPSAVSVTLSAAEGSSPDSNRDDINIPIARSSLDSSSPRNGAPQNDGRKIYAGTSVAGGIGQMRVEKIGQDTRMGQIAHTLGKTKDPLTPLQKQVAGLAKLISLTILSLAAVIFILGAARGKPIPLIFKLVVAMSVGAIPEGLVINLTALLALGMKRITKYKILVKNLIAAETLGNVTTLCLDKTGTLTEGKMRVIGSDFTDEKLGIIATAACNDRRDPLEIAMYDWVKNADGIFKEYTRSDEIPFSPAYKYIATLHPRLKGTVPFGGTVPSDLLLVSGAPEVLLAKSNLSDADKQKWKEKFDKYANDGSRLVAFAYKSLRRSAVIPNTSSVILNGVKDPANGESDTNIPIARSSLDSSPDLKSGIRMTGNEKFAMTLQDSDIKSLAWLGIIIFEDPIRESAAKALVYAQKIGLKIHVITGDHLATTEAVVRKLQGTITDSKRFTSSVILRSESASDMNIPIASPASRGELDSSSKTPQNDETEFWNDSDITIHARVSPEEKLNIVKKLQEQGEVVAMTGDGVNDALALKKADIGIVMGESSDVARETADLILLTNDFGGIAEAIREGRSILATFRNIIAYLLSHSLAEVILVGGGIFLPIPLPILATQILWTNMITDSLPGLALALERPNRKYRSVMKKLFTREVIVVILTASLLVGPLALGGFMYGWKTGGGVEIARSIAFVMLGAGSLFYALLLGSRKNIWLWIAVAAGILLVFAPVYMKWGQMALELKPLSLRQVTATFLASGFIMLMVGITKRISNKTNVIPSPVAGRGNLV